MRIVIMGAGKLGSAIARILAKEEHDVIVIDKDTEALKKLEDTESLPIEGSCVSLETLGSTDVARADIVIATTRSDEMNMLACFMARKLGAKYTIARIRDPEYLKSLDFIANTLKIDYITNPERATAREISRSLRLPFAASVETFAKGKVEMVEIRVTGDEPFIGIPLNQVYTQRKQMPHVLFCGVKRDGEAFIPRGNFIVQPGDDLFVIGDATTITSFFRYLGKSGEAAKSAIIVGGSRIAYYLAENLRDNNIQTKIIEMDEEKARRLDEKLKGVKVLHGDGTDQEYLLSEGLKSTDAFVALTDRDEENLMTGLYATKEGVNHVIVKNNRPNYSRLLSSVGLDGIISPSQIAGNIILKAVRARAAGGGCIERMYSIMDGEAEALEFIVGEDADYVGVQLCQLTIDKDSLIAIITRNGKPVVPFGTDSMSVGDHVVVITKRRHVVSLGNIVRNDP